MRKVKISERLLEKKRVKPTPTRILVAEELLKNNEAKSLQDMEEALPNADKVTIYRTIKTFLDNHIIHSVLLPDGQTKYALCEHAEHQHHVHPHFTCQKCGETHCLPETNIPLQDFPKNYKVSDVLLTLSGVCPKCSS
ncbi:Fur family ferric uptake transcriptional regulator [Balneicella halophila]|uniref:Fur family ferric uptake transcriptional regulator n=1 Tax=Balneicella halophila TaxID=1537566 RepID=A0A7L4UQ83_BALHA|nr:transcriptional repressor [Balneicella halophila]PVX51910.1 Fur family ferric uptake transcriptional regulator [Balneicella halophila]